MRQRARTCTRRLLERRQLLSLVLPSEHAELCRSRAVPMLDAAWVALSLAQGAERQAWPLALTALARAVHPRLAPPVSPSSSTLGGWGPACAVVVWAGGRCPRALVSKSAGADAAMLWTTAISVHEAYRSRRLEMWASCANLASKQSLAQP